MALFHQLFGAHRHSATPATGAPFERRAAVEASGAAQQAARLLRAPTALMQLTEREALTVVGFMRPRLYSSGTEIIRQGETADTGFMVLVLDGEITVENLIVSRVNATAAKLMAAVAQRLAERLREISQKLQVTNTLVATLQEEVDRLMPTPQGKHRR